jgi:CheY-like chemotaxis protein
MTGAALAEAIAATPQIARTPLVQIAPGASPGHLGARRADPRLTVVRPIRQSQLFDAVAVAMLGQHAPAEAASTPRSGARPTEATAGGPLVLLVDDNETNRVTATHQLTRLGYRVATANNGQEAVTALAAADHPYAIVLMDCQMPEMDGFAATRAIREREQAAGRHVPIVAMTANAMQGDRERCLSAGMDDYLSKPVRLEPLRQVLERWARTVEAGTHGATAKVYELDICRIYALNHCASLTWRKGRVARRCDRVVAAVNPDLHAVPPA